jgi:hypothetical protein
MATSEQREFMTTLPGELVPFSNCSSGEFIVARHLIVATCLKSNPFLAVAAEQGRYGGVKRYAEQNFYGIMVRRACRALDFHLYKRQLRGRRENLIFRSKLLAEEWEKNYENLRSNTGSVKHLREFIDATIFCPWKKIIPPDMLWETSTSAYFNPVPFLKKESAG